MESSQFKRYRLLAQVALWSILTLIFFLEALDYFDFLTALAYTAVAISIPMATAYFHYYLLLPLMNRERYWIYGTLTLLLLCLSAAASYFVVYCVPAFHLFLSTFWESFLYDFLLHTVIVAVLSLRYFVEAWYRNLTTESLLHNEKLAAELSFLKSQINPHFLFNTLNNIYAYAQTGNQKTAPMLERLSSILRFMVYDCAADRVELAKEVEAIEDLLEIHKMKNSEQQNIQLSVEGVRAYHLIAPLILVNFVENACKHSDAVTNPNGFIHIGIRVDEADVGHLAIRNSVKRRPRTPGVGGLGLENMRKRLDLQYQGHYVWRENGSAERYHLDLEIPLERKR